MTDNPRVDINLMCRWLGIPIDRYSVISEHEINTLPVLSLVAKCRGISLLVYASNPWDRDIRKKIQHVLDQTDPDKVFVLSPDAGDFFRKQSRWIYFPYFLIGQRWQANNQTVFKSFRFSFLSGVARFHRLFLYQHAKAQWTDHDVVAVHLRDIEHASFVQDLERYYDLDHRLTDDLPFETESAKVSVINQAWSSKSQNSVDYTNGHNAFAACVNIVTESSLDDTLIFMTEKIWKPIRSHCLFTTLASPGTIHTLKKWGFEIPESTDPELELDDKVRFIAHNIRSWDLGHCQDLLYQYRREIDHNWQHFYSQNIIDLFRDYLIEHLP